MFVKTSKTNVVARKSILGVSFKSADRCSSLEASTHSRAGLLSEMDGAVDSETLVCSGIAKRK